MTANGPVKFLFEVSNNMVTAMTVRRKVQSCLLLKKVTSINNLEKNWVIDTISLSIYSIYVAVSRLQ